jgi:hypothetical protein
MCKPLWRIAKRSRHTNKDGATASGTRQAVQASQSVILKIGDCQTSSQVGFAEAAEAEEPEAGPEAEDATDTEGSVEPEAGMGIPMPFFDFW